MPPEANKTDHLELAALLTGLDFWLFQSGVENKAWQELENLFQSHGFKQEKITESAGQVQKAFELAHRKKSPGSVPDFLEPILQLVDTGKPADHPKFGFKPGPLSSHLDQGFPVPAPQKLSGNDWKNSWLAFSAEAKKLHLPTGEGLDATLLHLLHKHAVNLPSTAGKGVSLYDLTKSVMGIALALDQANEECESPLRLVAGDISGIQGFLYDIVSKNAAKLLKGRSFYLQLLVDGVLWELQKEFKLRPAQTIYASGGGFFVLTGNQPGFEQRLRDLARKLAKKVFAVHRTRLTVGFQSLEIAETVFTETGGLSKAWTQLIRKGDAAKKQKFAHLFSQPEQAKKLFLPQGNGGFFFRDVVTNDEFAQDEEKYHLDNGKKLSGDQKPEDAPVKYSTLRQKELAKELSRAIIWIRAGDDLKLIRQFRKKESDYYGELKPFRPCETGQFHYFLSPEDFKLNQAKLRKCEGLTINTNDPEHQHFNFLDLDIPHATSRGFVFYGGNSYPTVSKELANQASELAKAEKDRMKEGDPLPYELIAQNEGSSTDEENGGFTRLGVLRMDVDNLGQLFSTGLEPLSPTLAHYSALSRSLDYFFMAWLNDHRERDPQHRDHIVLNYAGGDDLFLVGRWQEVIRIADEIQQHFQKWRGHREGLSLSGGVNIVTPKFPIIRAAEGAGEAEDKAKDHKIESPDQDLLEKNSFCLLGEPLHWELEFPLIKEMMEMFRELVEEGGEVSRGLCQQVMQMAAQREAQIKNKETQSWRWTLHWQLGRMVKRLPKEASDARERLAQLQLDLLENQWLGKRFSGKREHVIQLLAIGARWAELARRSSPGQKSEREIQISKS